MLVRLCQKVFRVLYQSEFCMQRDAVRASENVLEDECSIEKFHSSFVAVGEERVGRSNDVDEHTDLRLNQRAKSHADLREIPLGMTVLSSTLSSTRYAYDKTVDHAFVFHVFCMVECFV